MRTIPLLAASLAIVASTVAAQAAENLSWQVFLGPVPVAVAEARYAPEAGGRYRMTAKVDAGGPSQGLLAWAVDAQTAGRFAAGAAHPDRFSFDSTTRGRPRHMTVDFEADGARVVKAEPPLSRDGRPDVPRQATRGAVDPMTAFVTVGRSIAAGRGCDMTIPVFEGRWRYDLVLRDAGREELRPTALAPVGGPAHRCDVRYRPVAGFDARELQGWENVAGRAWFLPARDPGTWFPVRIEADLPMAMVTVAMRTPPDGR